MKVVLNSEINNLLKNKNLVFNKATESNADEIYQLFLERGEWFKNNNIDQWRNSFFSNFSLADLKKIITSSNFFILEQDNKIIAGFALSNESKYWEDDYPSYYINKIVVKPTYKNIGSLIINISKEIARVNKKLSLRLDCRRDNKKLNEIYENHGFKLVGYGQKGYYKYSLREMPISEKIKSKVDINHELRSKRSKL